MTLHARLHRLESVQRPRWVAFFLPIGAEPTSARCFDGRYRWETITRADGETLESFRARLQAMGADLRRADAMARAALALEDGGWAVPLSA